MKRIAICILVVLVGNCELLAHEMEHGSTTGLFGLKPEYMHVLLNPLPVYGLIIGVLVLGAGMIGRSVAARKIGLLIVVICAASAWPVLYFGQHAYDDLHSNLDSESLRWLDVHMERAEQLVYVFYLTGLLGIAALLTQKRFLKATKVLNVLALIAAIVALVSGGWISRAGGQIRHSEFRNGVAPAHPPNHENDSD